jgi:Zn-dependent protease
METLLAKISIMLVPALFAVTLHEVSHGYVADRCGDPTARILGRLTLNPLRHLDPIGTLALLFFGFGWARPVPVNSKNLGKPKSDMIWVALAGPVTNFSMALLSAIVLRALAFAGDSGLATATVLEPLELMAAFSLYINVILGIFNLIPIPPLDGGRVMTGLLPTGPARILARVEPFGFIIVIFLVFFTDMWRLVLAPIVSLFVSILAGSQVFMVERAINFLLAR